MVDSAQARSQPTSTSKAEKSFVDSPGDQRRERVKRGNGLLLFKLAAFVLCLGAFTYYFWPWSQTFPPEFQHSHIRNLNSTDFEPYVRFPDLSLMTV